MYSLRSIPRLDYAVLNDTGERVLHSVEGRGQVLKTVGGNFLEMEELIPHELKIKEDLRHSLDIYDLADLNNEEDINEGMRTISELSRNLRHVHVDLKSQLGEKYQEQYPDYPDLEKQCTQYSKAAIKQLNLVRNNGVANQTALAQKEQHELIKVSKEVVELKISQLRKSIDFDTVKEIDLIDGFISKMENLLYEYIEVKGKFRVIFRETYDKIYKDEFSKN